MSQLPVNGDGTSSIIDIAWLDIRKYALARKYISIRDFFKNNIGPRPGGVCNSNLDQCQ